MEPTEIEVSPGSTPKIQRLVKSELKSFALEWLGGEIFTSNMVKDQALLPQVFLPAGQGLFESWSSEELAQIGCLWARKEDATARVVEGYPVFDSCGVMHRDDWEIIRRILMLLIKKAEENENPVEEVLKGRT